MPIPSASNVDALNPKLAIRCFMVSSSPRAIVCRKYPKSTCSSPAYHGSACGGGIAGEGNRRRTRDRTDGRLVAHVQLDLPLEAQVTLNRRAGSNLDPRDAAAEMDELGALLDQDAAFHARRAVDRDVAGHRLDAARDVRSSQLDFAVDVAHAAQY